MLQIVRRERYVLRPISVACVAVNNYSPIRKKMFSPPARPDKSMLCLHRGHQYKSRYGCALAMLDHKIFSEASSRGNAIAMKTKTSLACFDPHENAYLGSTAEENEEGSITTMLSPVADHETY